MTTRRIARKPRRTVKLTKGLHLVIVGEPWAKRLQRFAYRHHRLLFILAVAGFALGLAAIKEGGLARLSLVGVAGECIQFCGDVIVDRFFPDGLLKRG